MGGGKEGQSLYIKCYFKEKSPKTNIVYDSYIMPELFYALYIYYILTHTILMPIHEVGTISILILKIEHWDTGVKYIILLFYNPLENNLIILITWKPINLLQGIYPKEITKNIPKTCIQKKRKRENSVGD